MANRLKGITNYRLSKIILYFLIYSFMGWMMEVSYVSALNGRFINRGFLIGPFCCIYGFGGILIITLLGRLKHNAFLLFTGAVAITTLLEYFTGYFLEKAFNSKWWDYSSQPLNVAGRICLRNSLIWGTAAVFVVYFIHPFIRYAAAMLLKNARPFMIYFIVIYFVTDFVLSSAMASNLRIYINIKSNHPLEIEGLIRYIKDFTLKSLEGIKIHMSQLLFYRL